MKPAFDSSKSNPLPYFVNSGKGMISTLKIVLILIWAWMVCIIDFFSYNYFPFRVFVLNECQFR